jgi:hypothetical protein
MASKKTINDFIVEANIVHNNKYDYSLSVYKNNSTKLIIICPIHGIFKQTPTGHIKGGCKACGLETRKITCLEKYGVEHPTQNATVLDKRKYTNMEKYGVEHILQLKDVRTQIEQTNLEKYGHICTQQNPDTNKKSRQTMLDRYGVEYSGQSKELTNKRKETCLEKYGVEHAWMNVLIRDKIRQTMVDRYGESPWSNISILDKRTQTNIEVHGTQYPQQLDVIKEKTKQTNLKKYGADNHNQQHMKDILPLINDYDWLFNQYITLGKTATQIAFELGLVEGTICKRLRTHEIDIRYNYNYSWLCVYWLESIAEQEGINIQHALNIGEYVIPGTRYKADGYCKETNTIYEFHGDRWHGNPQIFESNVKCHPYNEDITAGELYENTVKRENQIISLGYNLVVMWENNYNTIKGE